MCDGRGCDGSKQQQRVCGCRKVYLRTALGTEPCVLLMLGVRVSSECALECARLRGSYILPTVHAAIVRVLARV